MAATDIDRRVRKRKPSFMNRNQRIANDRMQIVFCWTRLLLLDIRMGLRMCFDSPVRESKTCINRPLYGNNLIEPYVRVCAIREVGQNAFYKEAESLEKLDKPRLPNVL